MLRVGRHLRLGGVRAAPPRRPRSPTPYWPRTESSNRIGAHGPQQLGLLVAHRVGVERRGRLHRHQRKHLEQVVLDDVADDSGLLVEPGPVLDADRLGDGDLHVVDVAVVPDRLEDRVGEPEREDVLDRLLAQVVVDADRSAAPGTAGGRSRPARARTRGRGRTASRSPPGRTPAGCSAWRRPSAGRSPGRSWTVWTGRTPGCPRCRARRRPGSSVLAERVEVGVVVEPAGVVVQPRGERRPEVLVDRRARVGLDRRLGKAAEPSSSMSVRA